MLRFLLPTFVLFFSLPSLADLTCKAERQDGGMHVSCDDGRQGFLDDHIPTDDIINVTYKVTLKNSTQTVTVKGTQLKELLNGEYLKNQRYPVAEKLAPFMNKTLKTKLKASDIVRVEPQTLAVSPAIKIYSTTTENGKQQIVHGYSQVETIDAVPVKVRHGRITNDVRDGGQHTQPADQ